MNDLLSELNATVGDDGSAGKKPDRPSSPLRPNPKYCSMEQPAGLFRPAANRKRTENKGEKPTACHTSPHLQKRGTPSHSAPHRDPGGTPTEFAARGSIIRAPPNAPRGMLQKLAEITGTPYSTPTLPPTPSPSVSSSPPAPPMVQKEASMGGGMEVDEEAPISDKSSSPIKPNEKYCKIVAPSKPHVAPRPLAAQLARSGRQSRNQDRVWRLDDDQLSPPQHPTYRSPTTVTDRNPDPPPPDPHNSSALPEPMDRSPSPVDYRTPPGLVAPLPIAGFYSRSTDAHYAGPGYGGQREGERRHSAGSHDLATTPSSRRVREKAIADWDRQREVEETARRRREKEHRDELERRKEREREKARMATARQRETDDYNDRKRREEQERREFQDRVEARRRVAQENQRIEAQREARLKAEEDDRRQRRYADDVHMEVERKRREEAERRERAQHHSHAGAQPLPGAGTVQMTTEQLEALKAECMAEGERKAMEEARKAAARRDESEPMDVEESDVVESSVPASCSGTAIAPRKLWIKSEPGSDYARPRKVKQEALDEIPLPATTPPGSPRVKEEEGKAKVKDEGKMKDGKGKKDDEKDLEIVEKPPAEVLTLSDGERGTVATVSGSTVAVKQEAKSREVDDDVWIVASKSGKKKKHVFDPSKVKKEKEEQPKASSAAQTPPILPFNAARVKVEPAEKAGPSGGKNNTTTSSSKTVKIEPADKAGPSRGGKKDTTTSSSKAVKAEPEKAGPSKGKEKDTTTSSSKAVKAEPEKAGPSKGKEKDTVRRKAAKAESGGGQEERTEYTVALPPRLLAPSPSKPTKPQSGGGEEVREDTVAPSPPIVGDEWSEVVDLMNQAKEPSPSKAVRPRSRAGEDERADTVDLPPRSPSAPPPDDDEGARQVKKAEDGAAVAIEPLDLNAALAAARRQIREIGETVQSAPQQLLQQQQQQMQEILQQQHEQQQQHQLKLQKKEQRRQRRLERQSDGPYEPAPGSFMHSLRAGPTKRKECWDADEEDWLRWNESLDRHWGAKRRRIDEEDD